MSRSRLLIAALVAIVVGAALTTGMRWPEGSRPEVTSAAQPDPSPAPPGSPWASGAWTGGRPTNAGIASFARWRGSAADTVTAYPAYDTWRQIATSNWHAEVFRNFDGTLAYGLPLLPKKQKASLADVTAGRHDGVWRSVASALARSGHADAFVRIGLEANGEWFPWGARADTADEFIAAYRHVAQVMAQEVPGLRFVFDITCGAPLTGSKDRLASLDRLYPGDDVVDVVGCDFYDSYSTKVGSQAEWREVLAPTTGVGLADLVEFARAHDKKFAVPEWGLTSRKEQGSGDNPLFIRLMHQFFAENQESLAFENYFDEPGALGSSLYRKEQNPRAGAVYRELW